MPFDSNEELLDDNYQDTVTPVPTDRDVGENTIQEGKRKIQNNEMRHPKIYPRELSGQGKN